MKTAEQIIETIAAPLSSKYQYTCKVSNGRVIVTNHKGQLAAEVYDNGSLQIDRKYKGAQALCGSVVSSFIRSLVEVA